MLELGRYVTLLLITRTSKNKQIAGYCCLLDSNDGYVLTQNVNVHLMMSFFRLRRWAKVNPAASWQDTRSAALHGTECDVCQLARRSHQTAAPVSISHPTSISDSLQKIFANWFPFTTWKLSEPCKLWFVRIDTGCFGCWEENSAMGAAFAKSACSQIFSPTLIIKIKRGKNGASEPWGNLTSVQ